MTPPRQRTSDELYDALNEIDSGFTADEPERRMLHDALGELLALRTQAAKPALSGAAQRGLKYLKQLAISGLTDRGDDILAFLDAVAPEGK